MFWFVCVLRNHSIRAYIFFNTTRGTSSFSFTVVMTTGPPPSLTHRWWELNSQTLIFLIRQSDTDYRGRQSSCARSRCGEMWADTPPPLKTTEQSPHRTSAQTGTRSCSASCGFLGTNLHQKKPDLSSVPFVSSATAGSCFVRGAAMASGFNNRSVIETVFQPNFQNRVSNANLLCIFGHVSVNILAFDPQVDKASRLKASDFTARGQKST